MTWVAWRQQRTETIIAVAVLAALAALLIPTGLQMAGAYDHDQIGRCIGQAGAVAACGTTLDNFTTRFTATGNLVAWMTIVPGIIGVLLAAPYVSELEQRTYRLDWTQSITRRRWIATKLGIASAATLAAALALTLLLTWWRTPLEHIHGRMANAVYDTEGLVPLGYALFALGLAVAIGAVWRRTAPSLVTAFAGYFGTRVFVDAWLRQRLASTRTAVWPSGSPGPKLDHAWIVQQYVADRHGRTLTEFGCPHNAGGACHPPAGSGFVHAVYHPASHFWLLQLRETGLFVVLALACLAFAAWWTHERLTA